MDQLGNSSEYFLPFENQKILGDDKPILFYIPIVQIFTKTILADFAEFFGQNICCR